MSRSIDEKNDEIRRRARKLSEKINGIGQSKKVCKKEMKVGSINTLETYRYVIFKYLLWREINGLPRGEQDKKRDMIRFLEDCAERCMQATISKYICALTLVFRIELGYIESKIPNRKNSKNYSLSEVLKIAQNLPKIHALSVLIVYFSGIRAHELLELRRRDEDRPTFTREWTPLRFDGMENFTIYVVTGKGGLKREIAIPNYLVEILESQRREAICIQRDRKINYKSLYLVTSGSRLSNIFSAASKKILGWSLGIHGLRHSYAKNRVLFLRKMGHAIEVVLKIVSEELGHFRLNIVFEYLR